VLIETYRPSRDRVARFGGGFSNGVACGLLLFLKISFFAGAVPLMVLALFYGRLDRRRYFAGLSAGFVLVALPMLRYLHFDWAAMERDLLQIALARHAENSKIWPIAASYFDWLGLALLVGFLYTTRVGAGAGASAPGSGCSVARPYTL